MRELLNSKVLTPKEWSLGVDFFENNFKNLKALLKNILHVKVSEVSLGLGLDLQIVVSPITDTKVLITIFYEKLLEL